MEYLIGITGKARSGKDTAARFFCQAGFRQTAFAEPLKQISSILCHEPLDFFNDDALKEQITPLMGATRRRVMQLVGSEAVKPLFGDDIWTRHLIQRLKIGTYGDKVVVSDVRYDYEAQALLERGGYIIEMRRRGAGLLGQAAQHSSEAGVNPEMVDFFVDNNGSVGELSHELGKILSYVVLSGTRK
jgi:hypothetical protein